MAGKVGFITASCPLKMPALQICRESCVFPDFGFIFCRNFMLAFFFQHIMLDQPLVAQWQEREKATTTQTVEARNATLITSQLQVMVGPTQAFPSISDMKGWFTLSPCLCADMIRLSVGRFFFLPQVTRSTSSFQPDR